MNIKHFAFAFLTFSCSAVFADNVTNALEESSAVKLPSVEAEIFYSTMKIERGIVENDESVFGYEAAIEWYGLFGGVEACYDMTHVNERKGRLNEIAPFVGYGYTYEGLTAKAAYVYKDCAIEGFYTQEVEAELEYETSWLTPYVALSCDTDEKPGALYGVAGFSRAWELCNRVSLVTCGEVGFGNSRRNEMDFELERAIFREIHLGAAFEIELCEHLKLVPSVDFYDSFTQAQRDAYDKFNGFFCTAGCRLATEF